MVYRNSRDYLLIIGIMIFASVLIFSPFVFAGKVQLPKDKEIKVSFDPGAKISSGKLKTGDTVNITLAEAIQIGGASIVEKGAAGKAVVVEAKKAGWLHKRGYIKVEFAELDGKGDFQPPAGTKIMLIGLVEKKGGKHLFPAIPILPLFLLKGGQGTIDGNSIYSAKIKESILLESK